MFDFTNVYTLNVFFLMVLFLIWRPRGINESIPPTVGAILIFFAGIVPLSDVFKILGIVSGASVTILSTIVMSLILSSIGFFRWAALNLVNRANGSGVSLFWYINLLCFFMTMFFNNDGSILITTPIIIEIVRILKLKYCEQFPYLISGALIATASSAPIAVSNLANLISLKIVGLNLNDYVSMMFVPSMVGISVLSLLLYWFFHKDIPKKIILVPMSFIEAQFVSCTSANQNQIKGLPHHHRPLRHFPHPIPQHHPKPPHVKPQHHPKPPHARVLPLPHEINNMIAIDKSMFKVCIIIVTLTRASLFIGASFNIPSEWFAIIGSLVLIGYRWYKKGVGPRDLVKKTPWHIILFAFSIYVVVYALHNIGLTEQLVMLLREPISSNYFNASLICGCLVAVMSNLLNNLPSVMIGTFALMSMGLDMSTLQIAYLASILGSDIGSLITPIGTLASLIWMFLLRKNGIPMSWRAYIKVTIMVIPISLLISLLSLYIWVGWLFL